MAEFVTEYGSDKYVFLTKSPSLISNIDPAVAIKLKQILSTNFVDLGFTL